ncbi:MAG: hypothetical protein PHT78_03520 [Desulfitobacteriaceae bacterium]|nr:hypothetical protein [Desulfitobacteriaceae bacterium]MDD4752312.1 hypothetical protein [Desulfitobacteriaceae bacterium]
MDDKMPGLSVEEVTAILSPAKVLKPSVSKAVKTLLDENNKRLLEYLASKKK